MAAIFHADGTLGQVLDDIFTFSRDIRQIGQVRDIFRVRPNLICVGLYMRIQGFQISTGRVVCTDIIVSLRIPSCIRRADTCFLVHRVASHETSIVSSNSAVAQFRLPCAYIRIGQVGGIHIGFHAVQLLQLCNVDGISIVRTGSHAIDLTGCI